MSLIDLSFICENVFPGFFEFILYLIQRLEVTSGPLSYQISLEVLDLTLLQSPGEVFLIHLNDLVQIYFLVYYFRCCLWHGESICSNPALSLLLSLSLLIELQLVGTLLPLDELLLFL